MVVTVDSGITAAEAHTTTVAAPMQLSRLLVSWRAKGATRSIG